jgi:UDP-N-acetyl-D-galactosamine dehydrogenase
VDVIAALTDYGIAVTTYDPIANPLEVKKEYNLVTKTNCQTAIDAVIL